MFLQYNTIGSISIYLAVYVVKLLHWLLDKKTQLELFAVGKSL